MIFRLNHIVPHPIQNQVGEDTVWNKEFAISSDKSYAVIAESGKGKSTFVSILYGNRQDFNGQLIIDNQSTKSFKLDDWTGLRKNKLSVVFQDLKLFGNHTLLDNLLVKNELTNHKTLSEIHHFIERLGLKGKEAQLCKTLSYGQQQRVAIIRALLQPFEFILLDEPFSHLDDNNAKIAMDLIQEECNANKANYLITSLNSNIQLNDLELIKI